ncbi:hypothetical protein IAT38_004890 [Cryptococcus sp. DSM 104549]
MLTSSLLIASLGMTGAMASSLATRATPKTSVIKFDFPVPRGDNFTISDDAPCGGYSAGATQDYPINGGDLALSLIKDMEDVQISYARLADSGSRSSFTALLPNVSHIYVGTSCNNGGDFSSLGFSAGDELTLAVVGRGGPNNLTFYNCADIKLVDSSSFTTSVNYTCYNTVTTTATGAKGDTTESASASAEASSSSLSLAGAGGIGAGVTLALLFAIIGGTYFAGVWSFGKKRQQRRSPELPLTHDDKSSVNSLGKPTRV